MIVKRIRDAVLVVGGLLTAIGAAPAEVVQVIAEYVEPIGGGVMAVIGLVGAVRSIRQRKDGEEE